MSTTYVWWWWACIDVCTGTGIHTSPYCQVQITMAPSVAALVIYSKHPLHLDMAKKIQVALYIIFMTMPAAVSGYSIHARYFYCKKVRTSVSGKLTNGIYTQ